eukprot:jgi/Botrbrau1/22587/Bobra.176_1s0017.1
MSIQSRVRFRYPIAVVSFQPESVFRCFHGGIHLEPISGVQKQRHGISPLQAESVPITRSIDVQEMHLHACRFGCIQIKFGCIDTKEIMSTRISWD